MSERPSFDMHELFTAVLRSLESQRARLNQLDAANGNHGDHMVAVFEVAVQSAAALQASHPGIEAQGISDAMLEASRRLETLQGNDSASVYAGGLALLAQRFRERSIELDDLVAYAAGLLSSQDAQAAVKAPAAGKELDVVKALLDALADWERRETNRSKAVQDQQIPSGTDLGYLFGAGMAYIQAKQKGGDRLDILSETAVNASPLGRTPHRAESGRLVIRTLLQSLSGGRG